MPVPVYLEAVRLRPTFASVDDVVAADAPAVAWALPQDDPIPRPCACSLNSRSSIWPSRFRWQGVALTRLRTVLARKLSATPASTALASMASRDVLAAVGDRVLLSAEASPAPSIQRRPDRRLHISSPAGAQGRRRPDRQHG